MIIISLLEYRMKYRFSGTIDSQIESELLLFVDLKDFDGSSNSY